MASPIIATEPLLKSELPHPSPAPSVLCPICCERVLTKSSSAEAVTLSACNHQSCHGCLVKWIEREEASGQTTPPTCPFCRSTIVEEDVLAILGRPFQPREANVEPIGLEQMDELTLQWINENTVPCRSCGSFIEKADGCNLIECLCGYQFCFQCGAPGRTCGCNPGHGFLNGDGRVSDEPVRDGNGIVDLRSCIRRRQVRLEREANQRETMAEEDSRWQCSEKLASLCTSNGRWMFSGKDGVSMLQNQLQYEERHRERENTRRRNDQAIEDYYHPASEEYSNFKLACVCTVNGRWMFSIKHSACIEMLHNQLQYEVKHREREMATRAYIQTRIREVRTGLGKYHDLNVSWIFLPRGYEIRAFNQLVVRGERQFQRKQKAENNARELEEYQQLETYLRPVWLYLPNSAGYRALKGIQLAMKKRIEKNDSFGVAENEEPSSIDQFINSGAWLFHKSTHAGSQEHLIKLCEHSKNHEKKNNWLYLFLEMPCKADCPGCAKRCLGSILKVFPNDNEDN